MASEPSVAAEAAKVLDKGAPLAERMRAVFHLRTAGGPVAVETLASAVEDMEGSCLFRHEVAFVLGQMGDAAAVPCLTRILENVEDDAIVRHEVREGCSMRGRVSKHVYGVHAVQFWCRPCLALAARSVT